MGGSREGGQGVQTPKVATGLLRNSGTDPLEEQLNPTGPIASRGRSVRASVKYVYTKMSGPLNRIFGCNYGFFFQLHYVSQTINDDHIPCLSSMDCV